MIALSKSFAVVSAAGAVLWGVGHVAGMEGAVAVAALLTVGAGGFFADQRRAHAS